MLDRGVPWSELILRGGGFVDDLNLQTHNRVSVVTIYLLLLSLGVGLWWPLAWLASALLSVTFLALNWPLYRFFAIKRGWSFALRHSHALAVLRVQRRCVRVGLSAHRRSRKTLAGCPRTGCILVGGIVLLHHSGWSMDGSHRR
jgi:hypothetical protein